MRPPDFSTRPSAAGEGRWAGWALGAAALLLAVSGASAGQALREKRAADASIAELRLALAGSRARVAELEQRQRAAGGDAATSQLVLTAEAPPPRVLAELAALLPPEVRVDAVSLSYGARLELDAQLVARRPEAYDLFLERLAESSSFADVVPGPEVREGEMRSSVRMSYARLP